MTNMQKYGATVPRRSTVGLTRMAATVTPRRLRPSFCSGTYYGRGYGLVFSKHWTKIRPICAPRRSCACTHTLRPQVTNPGYPGLSQVDILTYPGLYKSGFLIPTSSIQGYASLHILSRLILGYPNLCLKFRPGCRFSRCWMSLRRIFVSC